MTKDIMSSRLKVNAWNPSEVDLTALPACHSEFQVIGVPLEDDKFGFELHFNMRSVDVFLGAPFNIASYALLAKIIEDLTGYKALAIEATLKCVHFYDNQYDAVKTLLERNPDIHPNCEVLIKESDYARPVNIDTVFANYSINDFKLVGYTSDEEIKVEMLAPKEI
jgi:thymidylate synthase